jgi:hypothetical protein
MKTIARWILFLSLCIFKCQICAQFSLSYTKNGSQQNTNTNMITAIVLAARFSLATLIFSRFRNTVVVSCSAGTEFRLVVVPLPLASASTA